MTYWINFLYNISMETIRLVTSDNITLSANYWNGSGTKGTVLLHMMPTTKESWMQFAEMLFKKGFHVIAVDLRGHGASDGGPDGYRLFDDAEHQASVNDVEAAVEFLHSQNAKAISLVGASIGANLALWYGAEHHEIQSLVLLSPGNYRGIDTAPLVLKLSPNQLVFFASSEDDVRSAGNNAEFNRILYESVPESVQKKLIVYKNAGHGTDMLRLAEIGGLGKENPDLAKEIIEWIA